jgi:hypothetical protein
MYLVLKNAIVKHLQDVIVLSLLLGLLYYGAFQQVFSPGTDAAHYQCYAVAFWQGWSGLQKLAPGQCSFIVHPNSSLMVISQQELLHSMQQWNLPSGLIHFVAAQRSNQPYHALPYEYPWPALIPFSLGLVVPTPWYRYAFAIAMLLLIGSLYLTLLRWRSRSSALAYSLYLLVGGWTTAVARFDLIPAALTLFAVICAERKRWNWAFVCLALATFLKFYPAVLLVPFSLALQQERQGKWYAWRRWQPLAVFGGVCLLIIGTSLLLSVAGTLTPLVFFTNRPVQIESLSASILWVFSLLGKTSLTYVYTFGSINVLGALASNILSRMIQALIASLAYTWWLQWRRHLDLAMTCLLTLLTVIVTNKVFSPQYLIWVIPLAAYVGQGNRRWLLFWTTVGLLTSWVYPYIYAMVSYHLLIPDTLLFYPVTATRNFLLLGFILTLLASQPYLGFALSHSLCDDKEQTKSGNMQSGKKDPEQGLVEA